MVSTRDQLKQTKDKLVSPLKIHQKPNLKKKDNFEMDDSSNRLTTLEMIVSDLTSTVGELVEQLRLSNLAKASILATRRGCSHQRGRSRKKGVMEVDGDDDIAEMDSDSSYAESVKERSDVGNFTWGFGRRKRRARKRDMHLPQRQLKLIKEFFPTDFGVLHTFLLTRVSLFVLWINLRTPNSDYEDEKLESANVGGPLFDCSLEDIDISVLQIIMIEDLEELKELGFGTFGTVYHGKWRGTDVAIKQIKKSCFTSRSSEQERLTVEFWREAGILSKLHHPNVVAFLGVVQDGPRAKMATVTELMENGSLRHVIFRNYRHLDYRKRLIIAMDAAFGMESLHSKNIVHFDLNFSNLLVNLKDPRRSICKVNSPMDAPELLNGSFRKVFEKADVFSFGIVLWEILTGEEPYTNMQYGAIIGGILSKTR
ncbi:hypothetical protein GIB67_039939 [Kingdonia uniflora]|uniref:Protein kinase domain-containing protein n=1 Tax=Kingdonia uniflora TaxID=39325 RepID=A0A7J7P492_9MAGN|nr:hypothetical protein GIB67_039939 [Kingdonia uniflora]